jgi:bile acid:Na+ symporter, BASS family
MELRKSPLTSISHFVHEHFIWLLVGSYAVAALWPALGLEVRDVSFGSVALLGERTTVSLPVLMLATLLFNAGLGVQATQLRNLARRPMMLLTGLAANLLIPIAFIFGVTQVMGL